MLKRLPATVHQSSCCSQSNIINKNCTLVDHDFTRFNPHLSLDAYEQSENKKDQK